VTIKTYRAKSVAEALAQVKKDLGRDAVILHTRTYKVGGIRGALGLSSGSITEITASSHLPGSTTVPRKRPAPPAHIPAPVPACSEARPSPDAPSPASGHTPEKRLAAPAATAHVPPAPSKPGPPSALTPRDARASARLDAPGTAREARLPAPAAPPPQISSPADSSPSFLLDEIATIKRLVGRVLQSSRPGADRAAAGANPGMPQALTECYLKLLEAEVAAELADEIVGAVRDELNRAELADPGVVRQAVLRRLAAFIPVCDCPPAAQRAPDGRPLTIALIGPTGVGKTTTLAKLAATYRLRQSRSVALITSDTYRIAAVDQLRTYANIIGLPLRVALTPAEMSQACEESADADAVLIDTAGRSQLDTRRLDELRAFLDAARPHQTHLVLSSTASEAVLSDAVHRFGQLSPTHIIFTKLDEAVNFGVLINTARRIKARLSFVTTGQEVPDQIEPGNADRLARLVLRETAHSAAV